MFIEELNLLGFRNYLEAVVRFERQKTIIIGKNAQGKTSLLELIQILSGLRSRRATKDAELINFELETAIVHAKIRSAHDQRVADDSLKVTVLIRPSGRRSIKINDVNKSNSELSKIVNSVSFMAGDLDLVSGSPSLRRDWLDDLITQLDSSFAAKYKEFEQILSQRNAYLNKLIEMGVYSSRLSPSQQEELRLWNDFYIKVSNVIIVERQKYLEQIIPVVAKYYARIAQQEDLKLSYQGAELSNAELEASLAKDFARGYTTLGPQRHDIEFALAKNLNENSDLQYCLASSFASQGQKRSIVLALKLAELEMIRLERGAEPILLLDDVLAELDESRQEAVLEAIEPSTQVIITSTHIGAHLDKWSKDAQIIEVENGKIKGAMLTV